MCSRAGTSTLLFLIVFLFHSGACKENGGLLKNSENSLESSLGRYMNSFVGFLERFNDNHIGKSDLGKFLHYEEIKPKLENLGKQSRGMKKMGMALLPLIFHVGATSTWMLVTSLLAAKSVAIGMVLLIFKIAVSSAKVASFFTALKGKHDWTPHYEHHGHYRSFSEDHHPTYLEHAPAPTYHDHPTYLDHPPHDESPHSSFLPEWTPDSSSHYSGKALSTYKKDIEPFTYTKKGDYKKSR